MSDSQNGRMAAQIVLILVVAVLLVNVPISRRGGGLIHSLPQATSLVIYDGMVFRGSAPHVYVLVNHRLRPFASPDTFRHFDRRYHLHVQPVADELLAQFGRDAPIRRLVSCDSLAHIYALENGQKRLMTAFPTHHASPWDDIDAVACRDLHDLPTGSPIGELDPTVDRS